MLRWKRPCQLLEYVLITPRDRKLYHKAVGMALKPEVKQQGEETVHVWRVKDGSGFVPEPGMPGYTASKRAVFIVDNGVVTYEWVGPNPGVEPDYEAVAAALKAAVAFRSPRLRTGALPRKGSSTSK